MSSAPPIFDPQQNTRGLRVGAESVANGESETQFNPPPFPSNVASQLCKADVTRDDLTGLSLGPYALGNKIGGGGMGKVFAAQHVALDKAFAVKFIAANANAWPELRMRFEQEVKALGKLQHQHIVNAVDAGCVDGMQYLVTELLAGEDLAQLVQRCGAIAIPEACELVRQAAVGLAYSHQLGFVHRDIKPSNLILDRSGIVKILDFGLVRSASEEPGLTVEGEMLGTWDYVAPEQAQDARLVDHKSDIYGLGCTLIYLLSGQPPFSNARYSTAAAKLKGHLFDQPAWLETLPAHVPQELAKLLARMVAKTPSQRFNSADEVAAALAPLAKEANVQALYTSPTTPDKTVATHSSTERKSVSRWTAIALIVAAASIVSSVAWVSPSATKEQTPIPVAIAPVEPPPPTVAAKPDPEPTPTPPAENLKATISNAPARVTRETKQTSNAAAIRVKIPVVSSPAIKANVLGSLSE